MAQRATEKQAFEGVWQYSQTAATRTNAKL